ncbi:MAG: DUF4097 family beta strand repeat-containing protein [Anaerolineales bacterium]
MSDETIEKTFQVKAPARLIISNVRGSITILPGEANVIEVKAIKHGSFDNGNFSVEMNQDSDGTVRVETRSNDALFGFLSHTPKVDYSVRVPQGTHVDASAVSSSINVSDLEGVFKLKTVSGDMDIANLTGPFKLKAVSGDITGSHLAGVLELGTVSGNVKLLESNFPNADTSTVSGDVILQTPILAGPYQFGSVSGTVRLLVPAETQCNAELKSVSGSIRSSLPASTTRMGRGMKAAQIGKGGTAVRLKSVSGDLSFEVEGVPASNVSSRTSQEKPVMPTPPSASVEQPRAALSTEDILQRIERGELTVDEAIKLMEGQS